jgi:hypothetical protein
MTERPLSERIQDPENPGWDSLYLPELRALETERDALRTVARAAKEDSIDLRLWGGQCHRVNPMPATRRALAALREAGVEL